MLKILVIVNAHFGFDGISMVASNYYFYQDKTKVTMDFATINPVTAKLSIELQNNDSINFILPYRNTKPLKYMVELARIVKRGRYDIVHVHGNSATMAVELLAAKIGGCRIRIAHSHNTMCNHRIINRLLMPMFSRLYTSCCACSEEAGRFLFGNKKCYVVHNGIDCEKYQFNKILRDRIRLENKINGEIAIGHIGRFEPQKNHEFLLRVFASIAKKNPNVVLILVGDGGLFSDIQKLAANLGVNEKVIFYGTTEKVFEIVQAMDVFAFPSRFEGLGIAALEAQASGLSCVISTNVPQVVKCGGNVKFLDLDASNWENALIQMTVNPIEREKNATATQKLIRAAGYDIKDNCKSMLKFYSKLVQESVR